MAWTRDEMAAIAATELKDGDYVNLSIGILTLVANNLPEGISVTLLPGAAIFDSAMSFSMIRGGHVKVAIPGKSNSVRN